MHRKPSKTEPVRDWRNRAHCTVLHQRRCAKNVEQIAVFLDDREGLLAEITELLAENGSNIRALSLGDTADSGILRLIVNNIDRAVEVLKAGGLTVDTTEVLLLEVPDRPGGLASALKVIKDANLHVAYMYAFSKKSDELGLIIFRFDDPKKAYEALRAAGRRILSGEEVYAL